MSVDDLFSESPATPEKALPVVVAVDDDPDILAAVVRALKGHVDIIDVETPSQALDLIATRDVAVLLSDYEMPEMTGVDLAIEARRVRPETVRVLMTGRKSLDTAVEGINRGEVYRYVQKPFAIKTLRTAVDEAVARHFELVASAADRSRSHLREKLTAELEIEYPGITAVVRTADGAYQIEPGRAALLGDVGLGPIAILTQG